MDDIAQKPNVMPKNRGGIPINPIPSQPLSSSGSKEHGPIAAAPLMPDVSIMTETDIQKEEHEVEKKLEALIQPTPDPHKPKLPQDAKDAGLELAKENVPMPSEPSGKVVLPMSYDEALVTRKKYKWKDSIAWFAALLVYHWKRINYSDQKKEK